MDGAPTACTARDALVNQTAASAEQQRKQDQQIIELKRDLIVSRANNHALVEKLIQIRASRWYRIGRKLGLCR